MTERAPSEGLWLADRSILVIGGSTGIGLACAEACLAAGAEVCVTSHEPETLADAARRSGGRLQTIEGDARAPGSAEAAIEALVARTGRFDGLVHVAGGSGRRFGDGPLHEASDDGWHGTLDLNLTSAFRSNRAALRRFLAEGRGGAIVNLGSVLATSPAPAFFSTHTYAAAKAGLEGLTRSVAAYYAPDDIRVNAIVAGLTDTAMACRAMRDDAIRAYAAARQPLCGGGPAQPGDFAATCVFLLSDGARLITGQVLAVDGGWSVSDGFPLRVPDTTEEPVG